MIRILIESGNVQEYGRKIGNVVKSVDPVSEVSRDPTAVKYRIISSHAGGQNHKNYD